MKVGIGDWGLLIEDWGESAIHNPEFPLYNSN